MKKVNISRAIFSFTFLMIALLSSVVGADDRISKSESDSVIARIRAKYGPVFAAYRGIESTRDITVVEYDMNAGKQVSISRLRLTRRDYFYELPDITVLSYEKDGKKMKPSDYTPRKEAPLFPVFDREGASRYSVEVAGMQQVAGVRCYRVQVAPREATSRHFRGNLYYREDNLDQMLAEGSGAKFSMGVTGYWMSMRMDTLQGVPVIRGGTVTVTVDVALVYPNRKFVTQIKASNISIIKL